jgi:site-specific DNA recombinase
MKHCFGYVRVSSLKQGEGVSLDAQKDAILCFAKHNGITICKWFEEQQTAAKSGRPLFNTMLEALKAGKAEGVIMHKIDRSARNFFDWAKIGELADNGIEVHFATESLDFKSRGGRLTANIQMAVAEDYVRNLRAEVFKGQRGQLERGFYPFSAPIGYLNNGKRQLKTIDPVVGPLIRKSFELYASGQFSFETLRVEMAKRGFLQPNGKPRSKGCFEAFLANPFYAGIIRIKRSGETFQGKHEPLITPALFQQVLDVRAGKGSKKVTRHNHLFRGLFACGQCQRSMIPELQKGFVYYRCHFPDCAGNSIREECLADAVMEVLDAHQIEPELLAITKEKVADWMRNDACDEQEQLKACALQLSSINDRMEKLEDAAIEQLIDKESFQKRKQKLQLERASIEQKQRGIAQKRRDPDAVSHFLELVKNLAWHYEEASPAGKRELVEIALSNRSVHSKNVSIEPSNWLRDTYRAVSVLTCAHARTTSRTFYEDQALRQLSELAQTPEVEKLFSKFMNGYRIAADQ